MSFAIVDIGSIKPHPKNPSEISEASVRMLAEAMRTYGFTTPIEVQASTSTIVAGHRRYAAAKLLGLSRVPVVAHNMGDEEALAYLVANNQHGKHHKWAKPQLADVVVELEQLGFAPDVLGFEEKDIAKLFDLDAEEQEDGEQAEAAPLSYLVPGEYWHIGPARFEVYKNLDPEQMLAAEKLIEKIAKLVKAKPLLDGNPEFEFKHVMRQRSGA